MISLMKTDGKKILILPRNRVFLITTFFLSILFSVLFLFTINITQGKHVQELSRLEMLDITLLGIDVAAIMLIIFTANFIAKEFQTGSIFISLAITPNRRKYFLTKICFITLMSLLITFTLICGIVMINQLVLSLLKIDSLSFADPSFYFKLVGIMIMPVFYCLLSATSTFYMQSAAGGITYALSVMFLPALINMFLAPVSHKILPFLPEKSLSLLAEGNVHNGFMYAVFILILWICISTSLGIWKFTKMDF